MIEPHRRGGGEAMAASGGSPALLRLELRTILRRHRDRLGLYGRDVAQRIHDEFAGTFSEPKLSRIENGLQLPTPRDVSDLAFVYELTREERERLINLVAAAKRPGWWEEYDAAFEGIGAPPYELYADYESAAVGLRNYEATFVPGLLQTEAYAEAVFDLNPDFTAEQRDDRLRLRLRRQNRLDGPDPLRLHAIVQESSLLRTVGSREVMRDQIDHILTLSQQPHITFQVIPFDSGLYKGLEGSGFVLLDFPDPTILQTVAYVEGLLGNLFAETWEQTRTVIAAFEQMRGHVALSPEATSDFLVEIRDRPPGRSRWS